jgi:hypothetical protein
VRDLAFASRSEIKIICTQPPLNDFAVPPSSVGRLLASDAGIQPVVAKALEIGALARCCAEFLPPELARTVRAANFKEGRLVLLAATPAGAAKLKLLAEGLRKFLLEQGAEVKGVSVKVQPEGAAPAPSAPRARPALSPRAVSALADLHRRLRDSPARRALKTLLDHHVGPEPRTFSAAARKKAAARRRKKG